MSKRVRDEDVSEIVDSNLKVEKKKKKKRRKKKKSKKKELDNIKSVEPEIVITQEEVEEEVEVVDGPALGRFFPEKPAPPKVEPRCRFQSS